MNDEKGFTLIEVLASTIIISIILLSFMQVFANTNRIAKHNNEKLVVVNLAHSYLERLKITPYEFIENPKETPTPRYKYNGRNSGEETYSLSTCSSSGLDCGLFETIINDKDYKIIVKASQSEDESAIGLVNIEVTVKSSTSSLSSTVEGYVSDENTP